MSVIVKILPRWCICIIVVVVLWAGPVLGVKLQDNNRPVSVDVKDLKRHGLPTVSKEGNRDVRNTHHKLILHNNTFNKMDQHSKGQQPQSDVDQKTVFDSKFQDQHFNLDQNKAFDSVAQVDEAFDPIDSLQKIMLSSYLQGSVDYFRAVPRIYEMTGYQRVVGERCILDLIDLRKAVKSEDGEILAVLSAQGSVHNPAGVYQMCPSNHKVQLSNLDTDDLPPNHYPGFYLKFCIASFQAVERAGLCVPESCNYGDLNYILLQGFPLSYYRSLVCGKDLLIQKDRNYSIMFSVIVFILLFNLAATICQDNQLGAWISRVVRLTRFCAKTSCVRLFHVFYVSQLDVYSDRTDPEVVVQRGHIKDSTPLRARVLQCFHIPSNIHSLVSVEVQPGSIECLPAVRVVSMTMVVFFHTVYYYSGREIYNKDAYTSFLTSGQGIAVIKSNVCVEAFFVVSALLATIQALSSVDRVSSSLVYIGSSYLRRLWRLAPVYYLVLFSQTYLVPYWSDTPLYGSTQQRLCVTSLWSHLTFTFNLHIAWAGLDQIHCLPQSWFLGADMQLFLLVPWLALLYKKSRRIGMLVISLLPVVSFLLVTVLAFYKRENGWNSTWTMYSLPEHVNSYLSGVILGLVYHRGYLRPSRAALALLTLVFILSMYLVHTSNDGKLPLAISSSDVILFTSWRSCYGVMVAIVIYWCGVYQKNVVANLLSSPCWLPLSRLSYSVFLVSCVLQRHHSIQEKSWPSVWNPSNLIFDTSAFLILSMLLASAVWVFVEKPADNLAKVFWKRTKS